jgi:hypothetical protein
MRGFRGAQRKEIIRAFVDDKIRHEHNLSVSLAEFISRSDA